MSAPSISKFNKLITVQRRSLSHDDFGGICEEWVDLFNVWSQIIQIHNTPYQIKSKNFTHNFYKFYIRDKRGLSNLIRIKYEGNIYHVEKIQQIGNGTPLIEIIAYQKVKNVVSYKS